MPEKIEKTETLKIPIAVWVFGIAGLVALSIKAAGILGVVIGFLIGIRFCIWVYS